MWHEHDPIMVDFNDMIILKIIREKTSYAKEKEEIENPDQLPRVAFVLNKLA